VYSVLYIAKCTLIIYYDAGHWQVMHCTHVAVFKHLSLDDLLNSLLHYFVWCSVCEESVRQIHGKEQVGDEVANGDRLQDPLAHLYR